VVPRRLELNRDNDSMALQPAWKPLAIVLAVLLAAVLIGAAVVIADAMNLGFSLL